MRLSHPGHPIWNILRLAVVCVVLCFLLTFNYTNGFEIKKDLGTVLATLGALGGFDMLKHAVSKPPTTSDGTGHQSPPGEQGRV